MNSQMWTGEKVRLVMDNPDVMAEAYARWSRDSEYFRLLNSSPAQLWSVKKFKDWLSKDIEKPPQTEIFFSIRALEENRLLGFVGLVVYNGAREMPGLPLELATGRIGERVMALMPCA